MFSFNERERFETVESSLYIVPSWKLTDPLFLKVLLKMMIFPISSHFHPYLGKSSNFTNIFRMGWFNHQLATVSVSSTMHSQALLNVLASPFSLQWFL